MRTKSPVSSICRVAYAKRASSRSSGGIAAMPGRYRSTHKAPSSAYGRKPATQLSMRSISGAFGSGELRDAQQRPPGTAPTKRLGAADRDAGQCPAEFAVPIEQRALAFQAHDIGDKPPSGTQRGPERREEGWVGKAATHKDGTLGRES